MPLVPINKSRRRRIRRRPEWQDTRPPEKELQAAYDIAARHVTRWSRAYMAMSRELLTPGVNRTMRAALRRNDPKGAADAVPVFKKTDPEGTKVWRNLGRQLHGAYQDVVTEAGENEFRREKLPLTFEIAKAADPRTVPIVPINPWSLKWIDKESADLIRKVSLETRRQIKQVIRRGFSRGLRVEAILEQIQSRIGLLAAEDIAVQRRLDLMLSRGLPRGKAQIAANRYAKQLLRKRAMRIGRTETITAQSVGRRHAWAVARRNGELPGVVREWAAVMASPRTCPICQELDGKQVEIGENYHSKVLGRQVTGPGMSAHPQCLPGDMLVSAAEVLATTERVHDGPLVVIKTAGGHELACTPNHPILGEMGWVLAHAIEVGTNVVCGVGGDPGSPLVDVNHQHRPAPIHEVADTFRRTREVASAEVPLSAEDFHGDGRYSQVAVVWADRLLGHHAETPVDEHPDQALLIGAVCPAHLSAMGLVGQLGGGGLPSSGGLVRRSGLQLPSFGSGLRPFEQLGLMATPGLDPGLDENAPDGGSGDPEAIGDALLGLSGKVALHKVVDVGVQSFHGPVFNLETRSGWYVAQGIVTHNCRCVEILRKKRKRKR